MNYVEIKIDEIWQRVAIEDAWMFKGQPTWCASCFGAAYVTLDYSGVRTPTVTHRRRWPGCEKDDTKVSPRHPEAVE
jgi:hypothetical protein